MKYLFEIDHQGKIEFAPQVITIQEFKKLWEARLPNVELAVAELSAVFYFVDMRSPYNKLEEEERWREIAYDIIGDPKWIADDIIDACVEKYRQLSRTASMDSLESAWSAQKKIDVFLNTVDLTEKTDKGALVHNPKQIQMMLKDTPNIISALQATQKLVEMEIAEDNMLQAGRTKGEFEDEYDNPD